MSTSNNEAASSSTAEAPSKAKRAQPFTRNEVIFMAEFLERKSYSEGTRGSINHHKSSVLQELAVALEQKFGQTHSERQIQKRFSDLKVREPDLFTSIRQQIEKECTASSATEEVAQAATGVVEQAMVVSDLPVVYESDIVPMETANTANEELITLTLEPITVEQSMQMAQSAPACVTSAETLEQQVKMMIGQISSMQSVVLDRLSAFECYIDQRLTKIENEIVDIKNKLNATES